MTIELSDPTKSITDEEKHHPHLRVMEIKDKRYKRYKSVDHALTKFRNVIRKRWCEDADPSTFVIQTPGEMHVVSPRYFEKFDGPPLHAILGAVAKLSGQMKAEMYVGYVVIRSKCPDCDEAHWNVLFASTNGKVRRYGVYDIVKTKDGDERLEGWREIDDADHGGSGDPESAPDRIGRCRTGSISARRTENVSVK